MKVLRELYFIMEANGEITLISTIRKANNSGFSKFVYAVDKLNQKHNQTKLYIFHKNIRGECECSPPLPEIMRSRFPHLEEFARVSTAEVQWLSLALGEPISIFRRLFKSGTKLNFTTWFQGQNTFKS